LAIAASLSAPIQQWIGRFLQDGSAIMTNSAPQPGLDLTHRVTEIVEEALGGSPLFLVEARVRGGAGGHVIDVFIDSDEVLDVAVLARVNRDVRFLLETGEVFSGAYELNVSSPGVSRPLVLPRQYRKNVGRDVRIKLRSVNDLPAESVRGRLAAADDEGIDVELQADGTRRIRFADIDEARIELPW
jgi:ribosome maturation factor RimP